MKFSVCASPPGGGERLGMIVTRTGARLPTPRAALLTRAGSVPHVSRELLARLCPEPSLLLCPLSSALHLETGTSALGAGVAAFCGGRPEDAWLVTPEDASVETPTGHFRGNQVPLWTRHGKTMINAERYMDVMETFRPDAYVAPADGRAEAEDCSKRLCTAVDRTNAMLDVCARRHGESEYLRTNSALLGVLTGWGSGEALERSARRAAEQAALVGVLVARGARTATDDFPAGLAAALARVGAGKMRVLPGRCSAARVLACVALGCDVFDTSAPAAAAEAGRAALLPASVDGEGELCIDLNDTAYREDFTPLMRGCACVACSRHTRAYVHHLLRTRELLAPLLLTLHNLHNYGEFFAAIRAHIAAGTFNEFRLAVTRRHERHLVNEPPEPSGAGAANRECSVSSREGDTGDASGLASCSVRGERNAISQPEDKRQGNSPLKKPARKYGGESSSINKPAVRHRGVTSFGANGLAGEEHSGEVTSGSGDAIRLVDEKMRCDRPSSDTNGLAGEKCLSGREEPKEHVGEAGLGKKTINSCRLNGVNMVKDKV